MQEEWEEYWVADELLSYDGDVSIASSIRALGKSYDVMGLLINRIETKNLNCAWSRWDRDELKIAEKEFERRIDMDNYSRYALTKNSGSVYENTNTGTSMTFTTVKDAVKYKGIDIPKLSYWAYDEFLPEFYKTITRRRDEFSFWSSLYTTLRRDNRKFKAILISNCISWFNGYFDAWGIEPFPSGQIKRFPQHFCDEELGIDITMNVVMENIKPTKAMINRVIQDEVLKGKSKGEIMEYLSNRTKDIRTFVEKCPDREAPISSTQWLLNGKYYSYRTYNGLLYFFEHGLREGTHILCLNRSELKPGIVRDRGNAKVFEDMINASMVRFEDDGAQHAVYMMVKMGRERL